jgi:hypothetical protein
MRTVPRKPARPQCAPAGSQTLLWLHLPHYETSKQAEPLYEAFCGALEDKGIEVKRGVFGARMEVDLVNDGPVTIILEA